MPKPTEPDKIPITSPAQLRIELDSLHNALALEETEHTWEKIDKAVKRFQAVVRGGAGKKELADDYVRGMRDKTLANGLIRSLATERTRLSGSTLDLMGSSTRLGPQFAPLLPLYLPALLRLLCRTNKLYITRSTTTIISIVKNTKLVDVLRYIVSEWHGESGKSASFREKAAEITAYILSSSTGGEMQIEKDVLDRRIDELEWIIKTAAVDRDAKVRTEAKKCWEVYRREWPERVASFTSPMTPTIRRYLNVNAATSTTITSATTTSHSSNTGARAPVPVKRPRVPSALSSSVSHAPSHATTTTATSRPTTTLSRSVGAASRPLPSGASHRAPPPAEAASSIVAASSDNLTRATKDIHAGLGPPPNRSARAESSRTVSSSATSRPVSRNDDQRRDLSSSTTSYTSSRPHVSAISSSTTAANASSFRPTPASRSGTSSAPPFKPAVRTALKASSTAPGIAGAPVGEPRRARRIAQDPIPVSAPPTTAPLPVTSSASTLSHSASSTAVRSHPLSSSTSSRPLQPPVPSTTAPFRPHKPATSTHLSKVAPRTQTSVSTRSHPVSRPPVTAAPTSLGSRATEGPASSAQAARSQRDKERMQGKKQREKDRAEAKEKERVAAVAEVAALEAALAKRKEREAHEKEAEERRLTQMAEQAKEVPLPLEEGSTDDEADSEEDDIGMDEPEGEHLEQADTVAESQEAIAAEVGMESEYIIESQRSDVPSKEEIERFDDETSQEAQPEFRTVPVSSGSLVDEAAVEDDTATPEAKLVKDVKLSSEQDHSEVEPESPKDDNQSGGDLAPSSYLTDDDSAVPDSEPIQADPPTVRDDDHDISLESISTVGPSAEENVQASPSPLPDSSVALDTLAIASHSGETSLLADTTLPRSPLLSTAPSAPSYSSSTPHAGDSLAELFPTPVQQPVFAHLPPLSPEPCQTASIVLETPPRFDDPPAQLRLPGRPTVVLNFPGRARIVAAEEPVVNSIEPERALSHIHQNIEGETARYGSEAETEEEDEEEDSDAASPSRRPSTFNRQRMPPPTPLRSVPRAQRQPVFLPEEASYTDNDTSFEEQEETDEESYQVPLNDRDHDDSGLSEREVQQTQGPEVAEEDVDYSTPKAQDRFDVDISPRANAEDQGAGRSSRRHEEASEVRDEEEESRFELEQPHLRFHDETESEPEVTMEDMTLSESEHDNEDHEDEEEEAEPNPEPQPNILKRSLRSRVVTVALDSSSTKATSRIQSREALSEVQ